MISTRGAVNEYLVRGMARTDGLFGENPKLTSLRLDNTRLRSDYEKLRLDNTQWKQFNAQWKQYNVQLQQDNVQLQQGNAQLQQGNAQLQYKLDACDNEIKYLNKQLTEARENYRMTKYLPDQIARLTQGGDLLLNFLRDLVHNWVHKSGGKIRSEINDIVQQGEKLIHPKPVMR
jgi:predicted unusual protein kinase regulating ubiquinone biosynthesis (AarF/ABC1/UbiB family)